MAFKSVVLALILATASAAPNQESRVVGGTPTSIQEFPYIVSFQYHYTVPNIYIQRCVGSLISSWHVLTTAFCYTGAILDNMVVRAGSTYSLSGGVVTEIFSVTKHPGYLETPRINDIAVTTLTAPLYLSDSIGVLFLPPQGTFIPDLSILKIVSWGFESESGPQIEILKTVNLYKLGLEQCQQAFASETGVSIVDSVICAGLREGFGMCLGDSGAPMVIDNVVVGLSSFFKDCGSSVYPDVFTRIDRYTNWILEVSVAPGKNGISQTREGVIDSPIVSVQ